MNYFKHVIQFFTISCVVKSPMMNQMTTVKMIRRMMTRMKILKNRNFWIRSLMIRYQMTCYKNLMNNLNHLLNFS